MRRITAGKEHCGEYFSGLCIGACCGTSWPLPSKEATLIGFVANLVVVEARKRPRTWNQVKVIPLKTERGSYFQSQEKQYF